MLGTALGAGILGIGGRLAMRGITLWEGRLHLFTWRGTLAVIAWGAGLGLAAGLLRLAIDAAAERWFARRTGERVRALAFAAPCLAVMLILLTPWTVPRLVVFPPVVLCYLIAFESGWRRRVVGRRVFHSIL
jgi:hypothetical protein